MTLEEYEAVLAEKRAGLNQTREAAYKADESQFSGMKTFEKVEEDVGLSLVKNVKVGAAPPPPPPSSPPAAQPLSGTGTAGEQRARKPSQGCCWPGVPDASSLTAYGF